MDAAERVALRLEVSRDSAADRHVASGQRAQALEVLQDFQRTGIKNPFILDAIQKLSSRAS